MVSVEAIFWDLGGVLVRTQDHEPRRRWEAQLGLEPDGLSQFVFHSELGTRVQRGETTYDELWHWVAEQLDLESGELEQLRQDFWKGDLLDKDLVDYARSLGRRYRTGLISNAGPDLRPRLNEVWRIANLFDDIVISCEVGLVKPDLEIFRLALKRLQVQPSASIFVDDVETNVYAARVVGMHAIRFQDVDQIRLEMEPLLKPANPSA